MNIKGKCLEKNFEHYNYSLPIWQRRYEWKEPFWENIWKSSVNAYSTGSTDYSDVFLGTLLFQQLRPGDTHLHIIDGQQRLITITLLLSAIRDHASEDIDLQNKINKLILCNPSKYRQNIPNEKIKPFPLDEIYYRFFINGLTNSNAKSDHIISDLTLGSKSNTNFFFVQIYKSEDVS